MIMHRRSRPQFSSSDRWSDWHRIVLRYLIFSGGNFFRATPLKVSPLFEDTHDTAALSSSLMPKTSFSTGDPFNSPTLNLDSIFWEDDEYNLTKICFPIK